jgi:hypothetical protein
MQQPAEVEEVLNRKRLVEPELHSQLHDLLRRRPGAEQEDLGGVARDQVQDQKDEHRDPEQHWRRDGDPPSQESNQLGALYMLAAWKRTNAFTVNANPFNDDEPTKRPLEL